MILLRLKIIGNWKLGEYRWVKFNKQEEEHK